jgi:succinate-semialdehyde dehydrogenase/glutarate-semialdehyde dehydrogenase
MARADLRDELHTQVQAAVTHGARVVTGGAAAGTAGAYYRATILDGLQPDNPMYYEELFGPVATVARARDAEQAIAMANDTPFGLGGSIWTRDNARGEALARRLQCGSAFVNGLVKSDPRLPFGGTKESGYGRELSWHGQMEFVNIKTIWIK